MNKRRRYKAKDRRALLKRGREFWNDETAVARSVQRVLSILMDTTRTVTVNRSYDDRVVERDQTTVQRIAAEDGPDDWAYVG